MKTLNIIIPMGGFGTRFVKAGYTVPKPLIEVAGKPMIERVIENMRPTVPHRFIFICLKEHYEMYTLESVFSKTLSPGNYDVVLLDTVTDGAARTVLLAEKYIDNESGLLIANSDQYIETDINEFIADGRAEGTDGLILTFKDSDPKWSFAQVDARGYVTETAEKRPISDNATVGIYYFAKGKDYVRAAKTMIEKDLKQNGEFYVCPVYNELIAECKLVRIHEIPAEKMHGLGTPEDLDIFFKKLEAGTVTL
jgi:NDP-sugar pyrophosphorylase family protein